MAAANSENCAGASRRNSLTRWGFDPEIAVDENVPESPESLQAVEQPGWNDAVASELDKDVLVVLRADAEMSAENVVAHVEDDLGGKLQASLDGPAVPEVRVEGRWLDGGEFLEPRGDFFEAEESLPDRFGSKDQGSVPPVARPRAATGSGDMA
jgi:hypothetical protein